MIHPASDILTVYRREMKRFAAQKSRIFMIAFQPLIWLILMGSAMSGLVANHPADSITAPGGYIAYMCPGIMIMTALFSATFCGFSLVLDRTSGYLDRMLCSPLNRLAIPAGKMAGIATQTAFQASIIAAVGFLMGVRFASGIGGFLLSVAVCSLFSFAMAGLSLFIAAGFSSIEGLHPVLNFLTLPLMFTSTAIFPAEAMPAWMKFISRVNPLTAAVEPMRTLVLHGWVWPDIIPGTVVTALFALALLLIAGLRFKGIYSR
ncbi:MAG: ABC transporter [Chitinivibrionales bacterium]|nr:ABC transporter [Chitinivibrionales bacterium]